MNRSISSILVCAMMAGVMGPLAQAQSLTWDSTAGAPLNDGGGAWLNPNQWYSGGSPNATWIPGADAIFGAGSAGGAVTISGPTVANSLTFNSFTGTYTLGTTGNALTLTNGLTLNSSAGAVTIVSPVTLGAAQSWVNNSSSLLTVGTDTVSKAGNLLAIDGSGNTTISSIIDGAGGLNMIGAGTLTLNGTNANTFTGGLNITNGTVILYFLSRVANANLLDPGNALTLAGGTLQLTGNSANNSAQTLGNVTLAPGAGQILVNPNGAARRATLTLGTIPTSTPGTTLLVGKSSGAAGTNVITTTTATDATGIYGGRVVAFNGTANTGYDFATNSGAGPYTLTNYAGYTTLPTAATSDTLNDQMTGNTTLAGAQTHNTLKIGSGLTLANGGFNTVLTAGGLLSVGTVASTISGAGTLTADNGSGAYELIVHQYNSLGLTISSVITNNGINAVTLVKSGSQVLTLSGANTYSGGTLLNGGTLTITADAQLGNASGGLTFNGSATLNVGAFSTTRSITINNNAIANINISGGGTLTCTGAVTGNGGIMLAGLGGQNVILNNAGNSFTGPIWIGLTANNNFNGATLTVYSLADSASPITFGYGNSTPSQWNQSFIWKGSSDLVLNNRYFQLGPVASPDNKGCGYIENGNAGSTNTLTINTDLDVRTVGGVAKYLILKGVNTGNNTFAGRIGDGVGMSIILYKDNAGTWMLSGANTYSGGTTINGGTLGISNNLALGTGALTFSAAGTLRADLPALTVTNAVTINSAINGTMDTLTNALTLSGVISGAGNLIKASSGTLTLANTNTFTGTTTVSGGTLNLATNLALQNSALAASGAGTVTLGAGVTTPTIGGLSGATNLAAFINGYGNVTALTLNPAAAVSYSGVIADGAAGMTLTKSGAGTQTFTSTNTYTGATIINAGTLSCSTISTGGVASTLGLSSSNAANLVLNGGALQYSGNVATNTDRGFTIGSAGATLDASGSVAGTATLTWKGAPAYDIADVARSLTLTGAHTGTNTFAGSITNNGAGAVSVTKTGSGTWLLTGNNLYAGPTTISAGELMISSASNLGIGSNLVFNGGTLGITNTTLTKLSALASTISCTPGGTVTFDIANAANTFTVDMPIPGASSIVKIGPGSLLISSTNNILGPTTISGGALQYNDGDVIPTTPLLNNGALIVNRSSGNDLTQGVNFHCTMGGTGSLTNIGTGTLTLNKVNSYSGTTKANAGTITLSHPLALVNSAIDTTGAGRFTFSGLTAPIIGGLTGTTNLALAISSGYGSVTNLTINPTGTVTYAGDITNSANGAMALTMAGSGSQVFTNNNTYTGATILNAGTLQLSGPGRLTASPLTLSGGSLTLVNATNAEQNINRVNDSAAVTANGGTITFTNTIGTNIYAETIGSVALNSGRLDIVEGNSQIGQTGNQTLTLAGLSQSGNGTVAFTAAGGLQLAGNKNMMRVGGVTSNTPASKIIGPWATVGASAAGQSDYAIYTSDGTYGYVTGLGAVGVNNDATWSTTWADTSNYTLTNSTAGFTLSTNRNINTLMLSSSVGPIITLTVATNANLGTYGILNYGGRWLKIDATAGGVLTLPTTIPASLYLSTQAGAGLLSILAPISDNGAGALTLVWNGPSGGVLSLTGTSSYTGGTVLNGGQLQVTTDANLGNASGGITFNGSATLKTVATITTARSITLNNNAIANITPNTQNAGDLTVTGAVTGNGGITANGWIAVKLNSTGNTFTGPIWIGWPSVANNYDNLTVKSLADSVSPITFGNSQNTGLSGNQSFIWAGPSDLVLNNRYFQFAPLPTSDANHGHGSIENANAGSANILTINTDLDVRTVGGFTKTLYLMGVNTGNNTFAGRIGDGLGMSVGLGKAGTGTWIVSNPNNTYSGPTTISGGTLVINSIANFGAASSLLGAPYSLANGTISINGGTLQYTGSGHASDRVIGMTGATTLDASGTGPLVLSSGCTGSQALTLTGTSTATNTIGGALPGATLTKTGLGTWVLASTNSCTGVITVNAGTQMVDYASGYLNPACTLTLGGGTLTLKGTGAAKSQTLGNLTSTSQTYGGIVINQNGGAGMTLTLGNTWTRPGFNYSTLNIDLSSGPNATLTSSPAMNNGIVVGTSGGEAFATVTDATGTGFATVFNGNVVRTNAVTALTTNSNTATVNYKTRVGDPGYVANTMTLRTGGYTVNTLELDTSNGSGILDLNSTGLTLTDNAILVTGANSFTLQNTVSFGNSEIIIHQFAAGTLTINGTFFTGGSPQLVKDGPGTLIVNGANGNVVAWTILQGAVRLANALSVGTSATITIQNSGAMELAGGYNYSPRPINAAGTGVSNGGVLRNVSDTNTYGGAITLGTGGARINSDSGLLILTNTITTALGKDLTVGGAGNVMISGIISGVGSLIKDGAGTLTLANTNTYTGSTTISGGTLALGTNNALPSATAVTINNATLDAATFTNNLGTLTVVGAAKIILGTGAKLAFADSSARSWSAGSLQITGKWISGTSLRFGTSSSGLTAAQLAKFSYPGYSGFSLNASGYLIANQGGTAFFFR